MTKNLKNRPLGRSLRFLLVVYAYKFHIEDKRAIGFDLTHVTLAVCEAIRYEELPLAANRHKGERLLPAFDNL